MSANEIAMEDVSVLDATVGEVREVLRVPIELKILNVVHLKKIAVRGVSIGIAEVLRGSLSGKDIKAESKVGSRAEI